ncbi:hypothetical protein CLOP_g16127 [Closterium sp. NIES-67]|nr:hypothetical protein CLOP_g16127 [Closterium sp. NIES-67]
MAALRRTVHDVAPEAMPRLLHHVAETTGRHTTSKRYAVSLFAECARTYGQQMALHVPKVMTALVRALRAGARPTNGATMATSAASAAGAAGGTPGGTSSGGGGRSAASLHAACADVVVEMATHCTADDDEGAGSTAATAETLIGGQPGVALKVASSVIAAAAMLSALPSALSTLPLALSALPSALSALPSALSALPSALSALPSALSTLPSALSALPTALSALPYLHPAASSARIAAVILGRSTLLLAAICDPLAAELAEQHQHHVQQQQQQQQAAGVGGGGQAFAGDVEHDALSGAAKCLLALAQAGKWKQVPKASQERVFKALTAALGGLHRPLTLLQLAAELCHLDASLAKFHAKTLLRAGKEVLRGASAVDHRFYAVRLLKEGMRSCSAAVFQAELRDVVALLRDAANHARLKDEALAAGKAIKDKKKQFPRAGGASSAVKSAVRSRPDAARRAAQAEPGMADSHGTAAAGSSREGEQRQLGERRQQQQWVEGEWQSSTSPTHSAVSSSAASSPPARRLPSFSPFTTAPAASHPSHPSRPAGDADPTLYFTPVGALPLESSLLHSSAQAASVAAAVEQAAAAKEGSSSAFQSPPRQFTAFQAQGTANHTSTAVHGSAISTAAPSSTLQAPYTFRSPSFSPFIPSPSVYLGPGGSTHGKAFVSPGPGAAIESPDGVRSVRRRVFQEDTPVRGVQCAPFSPGLDSLQSPHKSFGSAESSQPPSRNTGKSTGRVVERGEQENAGAGMSWHKAVGPPAGGGSGGGERECNPASASSKGNTKGAFSPSLSHGGRGEFGRAKSSSPSSTRGNSPMYELAAAFVRARKSPDLLGRAGALSLNAASPSFPSPYRLGGSRMAGGVLATAAGAAGGGISGNPMRTTLSDSAMAPDSSSTSFSLHPSRRCSPFTSPDASHQPSRSHLSSSPDVSSQPFNRQPVATRLAGTAEGSGEAGEAGFLLQLRGADGAHGKAHENSSSAGIGSSGVFVRLSGEVEHAGGVGEASRGEGKGEGDGEGGGEGAVVAADVGMRGEGSDADRGALAPQASAAGSSPGSTAAPGEGNPGLGDGGGEYESSSGFCRLMSDAEVASALASLPASSKPSGSSTAGSHSSAIPADTTTHCATLPMDRTPPPLHRTSEPPPPSNTQPPASLLFAPPPPIPASMQHIPPCQPRTQQEEGAGQSGEERWWEQQGEGWQHGQGSASRGEAGEGEGEQREAQGEGRGGLYQFGSSCLSPPGSIGRWALQGKAPPPMALFTEGGSGATSARDSATSARGSVASGRGGGDAAALGSSQSLRARLQLVKAAGGLSKPRYSSPIRPDDLDCPVPLTALARSLQHTPVSEGEVDVLLHQRPCRGAPDSPRGTESTRNSPVVARPNAPTAPTGATPTATTTPGSNSSANSGASGSVSPFPHMCGRVSPFPHMCGSMLAAPWSMRTNPMADTATHNSNHAGGAAADDAGGGDDTDAWEEEVQEEHSELEATAREEQQVVEQLQQCVQGMGGEEAEREGSGRKERAHETTAGTQARPGATTEEGEGAEQTQQQQQQQRCQAVSGEAGAATEVWNRVTGGTTIDAGSKTCDGRNAVGARADAAAGLLARRRGDSDKAGNPGLKGNGSGGDLSHSSEMSGAPHGAESDSDGEEEGGGEVEGERGVMAWVLALIAAAERGVEGVLQVLLLAVLVLLLALVGGRVAQVLQTATPEGDDFVPT